MARQYAILDVLLELAGARGKCQRERRETWLCFNSSKEEEGEDGGKSRARLHTEAVGC